MARQNLYVQPARKHMEAYQNFGGGINSVTSNDNLLDSELPDLINIDLGERGSLKRRYGMVNVVPTPVTGKVQGYFRYYRTDYSYEEIIAVNGKLYKDGSELLISQIGTFQTEREVQAVQFQDKLFIATGTKLLQYNGDKVEPVAAYRPNPMEALYIGTNGLADNPDAYLTDGESAFLRIDGVIPTEGGKQVQQGLVGVNTTFTVYVSKPINATIEYRLDYRRQGTETWTQARNWGTSKTFSFNRTDAADWELRFKARVQGQTVEEDYIIPAWSTVSSREPLEDNMVGIHTCNRILVHFSQVFLYGSTTHTKRIYVSDIARPDYYPMSNTLDFENPRSEALNALVPFRNNLVAFTNTTIQALFGSNPENFTRRIINSSVGCIAPNSAQVMGNYIAFLAQDGVHILKSVSMSDDRFNVQKVDEKVDNLIPRNSKACGVVADGQYHLTFPDQQKRMRFYYDQGVWTKDESTKLEFTQMFVFDGEVYGLGPDGVQRFDPTTYEDDGVVYQDLIRTKDFDFGEPYHPKKLKELQLLMKTPRTNNNIAVYIYADDAAVLNPDKSRAEVVDGEVVWVIDNNPNIKQATGTVLGGWEMGKNPFGYVGTLFHKLKVSGKCLRVRLEIQHLEPNDHHFLGLALIFKTKSP